MIAARQATVTVAAVEPVSVLAAFDATATSAAAKIETRKREAALPVISLYRWWARRTAAVSTALVDATSTTLGRDQLVVADPFAGGGVIALAALLRGHRVLAQELDPWAAQNLATMATPGDPDELRSLEAHLDAVAADALGRYATTLPDGTPARLGHTLRVAVTDCPTDGCTTTMRLFPTALVSRTARVDAKASTASSPTWFACPDGHLHRHRHANHRCPTCRKLVRTDARYTTGRFVTCTGCKHRHDVARLLAGGARWEPVLVQRIAGTTTEIDEPTLDERDRAGAHAAGRLAAVPAGSETSILLRAGFGDFADLYPARQRQVLDALLAVIDTADGFSTWARSIARSCVIGSAEFAGLASRWDANYLKPYETVASHRYNVTTLAAEIDPWGERGRGTVRRRLRAAAKAARWLQDQHAPARVHTRTGHTKRRPLGAGLTVVTGSSTRIPVPDRTIDVVLTDPPYHDDVQYAELASLFRSWDGQRVGRLDGDVTAARSGGPAELARFEQALADVFAECRRVVTDDGHLLLSFANREPQAWVALCAALQSTGWHAAGFDVVHSENETDHAKAGRRACSLDVLVDLVTEPVPAEVRHRPNRVPQTAEEKYCFALGEHILRIGELAGNWRSDVDTQLRILPFLQPAPRKAAG